MKKMMSSIIAMVFSSQLYAASPQAVLTHYADLAEAMYGDSLTTARSLQKTVNTFIAAPTESNLQSAKTAWIVARQPYQQTEAYRFGNAIVDEWEGKVNSWPLDEGLIDYVATSYGSESDENPYYTANIIANPKLILSGKSIDASIINKQLLSDTLHEVDEVESNVATGYHAIEFMLWGQDLNGNNAGSGARPATDFDSEKCTHGNCDRRAAYLKAATDLLIDDLQWMVDQWTSTGAARKTITTGDLQSNIATIFSGMGSLSYGELAGERMKLGLMLHDPEEEHDCFSDNTHWSHYNDALGISNVYTGSYTRVNGKTMTGPSLSDLVAAQSQATDTNLRKHLNKTLDKMQVLVDSAKNGEAYDQLIGENNSAGNAKVKAAIDALVAQTRAIEKAVHVMGLDAMTFEGSDSLDAPHKVK